MLRTSAQLRRASIIQLCSTPDVESNFGIYSGLLRDSAAAGAKICFLPEAFDYVANSVKESIDLAGGYKKLLERIQEVARSEQIWVSLAQAACIQKNNTTTKSQTLTFC